MTASFGIISLLRSHVSFRRLWLSQLISELGDWFQIVALLSLMPTRNAHAHQVAGLLMVRMLPALLFVGVAGTIADRFHRGRVMVVCDFFRVFLTLAFIFLAKQENGLSVFWVYVLSFAQESMTSVFEPARGAAIPQVVPKPFLMAANALSGATWSAMVAVGAALGGLATRYVGFHTAILLNALSFVASAILVLWANVPPIKQAEKLHSKDQAQLREAIRYLRKHPATFQVALLKGILGLTGGILVLFAVFSDQVFGASHERDVATTLSLLYIGRGAGAFLGPMMSARLVSNVAGYAKALLFAFPLIVLGYLAFAGSRWPWQAAMALFLGEGARSVVWVHSTQLLQLAVPNHVLGRVLSIELAVFMLTMALSCLFTGLFLDWNWMTPRFAVFLIAVVMALATLLCWMRYRACVQALSNLQE